MKHINKYFKIATATLSLLALTAVSSATDMSNMTIHIPDNVILSEADRNHFWGERFTNPNSFLHKDFQTHMNVITESKPYYMEDSLLLDSGIMSYPVRFKLLENAKHSIVMSTFSIYSGKKNGEIKDKMTKRMVELLIAAKKRGVFVLVFVDGATSVLAQSQHAIKVMRDNGIIVQKFNPLVSQTKDPNVIASAPSALVKMIKGRYPITNRWHEKTLVVDGKYVLSGGLNWGELYGNGNAFTAMTEDSNKFYNDPLVREVGVTYQAQWSETRKKSWRDTDILVKGDVARTAMRKLIKDHLLLHVMQNGGGSDMYKDATAEEYAQAEELYEKYYNSNPSFSRLMNWHESPRYYARNVRYITQRPYVERKDPLGKQVERVTYAKENGLYVTDKKQKSRVVGKNLRITDFYINIINKAQKQILWGCHSNRPTKEILSALRNAAARGVKIHIIGNSRESAKTLPEFGLMMYPLGKMHYKKFLKAGAGNIKLYEWQGSIKLPNGEKVKNGAFHSKVFSVDGVLTSVGSYNISKASFGKHTEGTLVLQDKDFAREAEAMFLKDLTFSKEITLEVQKAAKKRNRRR